MIHITKRKRIFLALLLPLMVSSVMAQNKVVVVPLGGDEKVTAEELVPQFEIVPDPSSCAPSICFDSPELALCPAGQVMVGMHMPEFGGDEGGCNQTSSGAIAQDDFSIICCDMIIRVVEND